jgi:hypothetical protein
VGPSHRSDSPEQREAEPLIRAGVEAALGDVSLTPRSLTLPNGARADVDGVDADQRVFVEISSPSRVGCAAHSFTRSPGTR